ncbi:type II toxin-antitoxin system HicA family toxin [Myxosarcina sp. GI1]|uniref:type II toxin-antitoxin system HicA family toxin n=1 Tax=Myxosarcina sp. GI1 TaxID=1541065 RepID=UPI00056466CC
MKLKRLQSQLKNAGFICLRNRGKGSHRIWRHSVCSVVIIQSGKVGSDAKPYQIKNVLSAIKIVKEEVLNVQ